MKSARQAALVFILLIGCLGSQEAADPPPPRDPEVAKSPVPSESGFVCDTVPAGATVYINDRPWPELTPTTVKVAPGEYQVRIERKGMQTKTFPWTVYRGHIDKIRMQRMQLAPHLWPGTDDIGDFHVMIENKYGPFEFFSSGKILFHKWPENSSQIGEMGIHCSFNTDPSLVAGLLNRDNLDALLTQVREPHINTHTNVGPISFSIFAYNHLEEGNLRYNLLTTLDGFFIRLAKLTMPCARWVYDGPRLEQLASAQASSCIQEIPALRNAGPSTRRPIIDVVLDGTQGVPTSIAVVRGPRRLGPCLMGHLAGLTAGPSSIETNPTYRWTLGRPPPPPPPPKRPIL